MMNIYNKRYWFASLESWYISCNQSAIKVLKRNISFISHEVTLVYRLHMYNFLESHKTENLIKRVWTNIVKNKLWNWTIHVSTAAVHIWIMSYIYHVRRTGIAEVAGSNPVEALFFQSSSSSQLLKLDNLIYCDDHSLLSSTTAVHIWIISWILHARINFVEKTYPLLDNRGKEHPLIKIASLHPVSTWWGGHPPSQGGWSDHSWPPGLS